MWIAAAVSAVIAGLFGVLIKSVPEGSIHFPPYHGGTVTQSAPGQICQVVRFWVPSKFTGNGDPHAIMLDLNKAVTKSYGGWTRWAVNGEWKNSKTHDISAEGGFLYEVGIKECNDLPVKNLRDLVEDYVKNKMNQDSLYFVATRFDKPK